MRPTNRRRAGWAVVGALTAAALSACGAGADASPPNWTPQPQFGADTANPQLPGGEQVPGPSSPGPGAPSTGTTAPAQDPNVVATRLTAPTGIALLPDGTALVGERTTGRIVRVQPVAGRPVTTVRTLGGLDTSGDGGLLDLALSPSYDQDGLVYAYVTTPSGNQVVHFTLTGASTPVVTSIPKGSRDNAGHLLFDKTGRLFIGTGDAGNPAAAAARAGLAGKVLRVDDIGNPAAGNPVAGSPVYATGVRTVDGLCADPDSGTIFQVQARAGGSPDELNVITAGADYGWPTPRADSVSTVVPLPAKAAGAAGCAVMGNRIYLAARDGQSVQAAPISRAAGTGAPMVGTFTEVVGARYGRLLSLVAAPDGALWITTTNKDGHGKPIAADERVLRITPAGASTTNPTV